MGERTSAHHPAGPSSQTAAGRLLLACLGAAGAVAGAGCTRPSSPPPPPVRPVLAAAVTLPPTPAPGVAGDAAVGARLVVSTGCVGCHTLDGVPAATGLAGPNLTNVALRPTLAGTSLPNSPDMLQRWLLDPPALKPGTRMPNLGLTDQEARDIAAFLYSQPYNPGR